MSATDVRTRVLNTVDPGEVIELAKDLVANKVAVTFEKEDTSPF